MKLSILVACGAVVALVCSVVWATEYHPFAKSYNALALVTKVAPRHVETRQIDGQTVVRSDAITRLLIAEVQIGNARYPVDEEFQGFQLETPSVGDAASCLVIFGPFTGKIRSVFACEPSGVDNVRGMLREANANHNEIK